MIFKKERVKKVILLPDFHHPYHNKKAVKAVFEFIKWFKPDEVNILGDAMNMNFANHWKIKEQDHEYFEKVTVKGNYETFDNDILTPIENLIPRGCKKTYLGGNHEDWVNIITRKDRRFRGIVEPELVLNLAKRNWEWIPYIQENKRGIKQYGKLLAFHGLYTNKYHAQKTADTFSKSCIYCHTHDIQSYTKITVDDDRGFHTAQSIGCLCNLSPEFLKGRMNRWVNSFAILYVRDDGNYNTYVPVIIDGKFTFAGRTFGN